MEVCTVHLRRFGDAFRYLEALQEALALVMHPKPAAEPLQPVLCSLSPVLMSLHKQDCMVQECVLVRCKVSALRCAGACDDQHAYACA